MLLYGFWQCIASYSGRKKNAQMFKIHKVRLVMYIEFRKRSCHFCVNYLRQQMNFKECQVSCVTRIYQLSIPASYLANFQFKYFRVNVYNYQVSFVFNYLHFQLFSNYYFIFRKFHSFCVQFYGFYYKRFN